MQPGERVTKGLGVVNSKLVGAIIFILEHGEPSKMPHFLSLILTIVYVLNILGSSNLDLSKENLNETPICYATHGELGAVG